MEALADVILINAERCGGGARACKISALAGMRGVLQAAHVVVIRTGSEATSVGHPLCEHERARVGVWASTHTCVHADAHAPIEWCLPQGPQNVWISNTTKGGLRMFGSQTPSRG
eukprot:scaffold3522_cov19-Tisochrysis_lutea.AAC.1